MKDTIVLIRAKRIHPNGIYPSMMPPRLPATVTLRSCQFHHSCSLQDIQQDRCGSHEGVEQTLPEIKIDDISSPRTQLVQFQLSISLDVHTVKTNVIHAPEFYSTTADSDFRTYVNSIRLLQIQPP
jgi:hypothetical protein